MSKAITVNIPHELGREEARRRIEEGFSRFSSQMGAAAGAFTKSWEGREHEIKPYPHQLKEVGEPASNAGRIGGDVDYGVLPSGQSAGLISAIESAGEVVRRTAEEASRIIETFAQTARQATAR